MLIKVLLLLFLLFICILPILFDKKLTVGEGDTRYEEQHKNRKRYKRNSPRYTGPKTDEKINRMLAKSIVLMKELGVPISSSICPEVTLNASHSYFGKCCSKGSKKKYSVYDFYIEISRFTLGNTERSLRNTLIHELLHTVPGGQCHTGEWKKWAKYVSAKTGYHISRCGCEDETESDLKNLQYEGNGKEFSRTPIIGG